MSPESATDAGAAPLAALADAAKALADGRTLDETVHAVLAGACSAVGASLAVARVLDADGTSLVARAVVSSSPAVAAEVAASRIPLSVVTDGSHATAGIGPALRAAAERLSAGAVLQVPARANGHVLGTLELVRRGAGFSAQEELAARIAADHLAAAIRAHAVATGNGRSVAAHALELAGEALAAGSDEERAAAEVARLAAHATGARAAIVWRGGDAQPGVVASFRADESELTGPARELAARALETTDGVAVERADGVAFATLKLGEPPLCALQLVFAGGDVPTDDTLAILETFAVRAAHALRSGERARTAALELERTRELLALVGRVNAELSLAHRLDTATDRLAELLEMPRLAVYLREGGALETAAARGLDGPHAAIAERLLELALGPFRARGVLILPRARYDARLAGLEPELEAADVEAAIAVPLVVRDEVTGLLALYPRRGRTLSEHETELVTALAAQLAVAVQNARLHERATNLGVELERVLALERQSTRQLGALYEISRSFVQSLSLEATLDAVARTVVELLDADAAVIRMPEARRDVLTPRAVHVADPRLEDALRPLLGVPQPLEKLPGRRLLRQGKALVLDAATATALAGGHEVLVPFLERGATAAVLPIATPGELLGTLTLVSFDPERPIVHEGVELALSVSGQAALAIDNARLYQHEKYFAETMQRSLLPRTLPEVPGFRLGAIYASSARLELGGDVYDYMALPGGRLAVVLGDVTGHGVEATADMAMAKFVFRSLAREHPDPADFLSSANEVVYGEIPTGKFITMVALRIDPERAELACASAGHPRPRLLLADGSVHTIDAGGLALGVEPGQTYEETRATIPAGASVVLYTDGVVEARRGGEVYGEERLDAVLARRASLSPQDLAAAVIADCRAFAGGELEDDCAVVAIRRTSG